MLSSCKGNKNVLLNVPLVYSVNILFFKEQSLSSTNFINVLNHQNVNLSEIYKQKAILIEVSEKSSQVKFNKNAQIKSNKRNLY